MNSYDFLDLLIENSEYYLLSLLFSILIYWVILKKFILALIDPLLTSCVFSCFGFSVVFFLFITDTINYYYFISYLITQIVFWYGISNGFKFQKVIPRNLFSIHNEMHFIKCVFIISFLIYILTQIMSYVILGIPIFLESRLDAAANAKGGMGILTRFSRLNILCLYFVFLFWKCKKVSLLFHLRNLTIVFFVFFSILGGSKSAFFLIAHIYFCYLVLNSNDFLQSESFKAIQNKFIILGGVTAVLVIIISTDSNIQSGMMSLLFRFVGSGDVYWMAYPEGTLENLPKENIFVVLFQSLLGFLRILPHSEFPEPLGYTLSSYFYDKTSLTGANARHNIMGYVYCGFLGSCIFSFIIGLYVGVVRKLYLRLKNNNQICKILVLLLFVNLGSLETDPTLYFSYLTDLFVVIPFIIILSTILYIALYGKEKNSDFISNV